ncbi:MAG: Na+/H+ antiporter subunit E [Actinomycetota bacterium]
MKNVRRGVLYVLLIVLWCGLWGEVTVANILSGAVVAVVTAMAGSVSAGSVRFRPLATFAWLVGIDLVVSTAAVVREVLTPTDYTDEAIVAVHLPDDARHHLLLLFGSITLTPGTAVVAADVSDQHVVVYLHVLHADRRDATVEHVVRIAELACEAFPHGPSAPVVAASESEVTS